MEQVPLGKTLDVQAVERQLADLWQQSATDRLSAKEAPILRARVANVIVFLPGESLLDELRATIQQLTTIHPSRVLVMVGDRSASDQDIEMYVSTFCQTDRISGAKRLCCEEVILKAQGKFVSELPSAALPLLVSDLTTFLWWRDAIQADEKLFEMLLRASDRLVVDSNEFEDSRDGLIQLNAIFSERKFKNVGISDINWARLTFWRGLLADFYDVPANQTWLDQIDSVRVDYVAPERTPEAPASQALLICGWLASRLGWNSVSKERERDQQGTLTFILQTSGRREINLELRRVERAGLRPGRLVQVELRAQDSQQQTTFTVGRSDDSHHVLAETKLGDRIQRGRVLPVRNRSAAQLLSREMEILSNDDIYQEALAVATTLINMLGSPSPDQP